MANDQEQFNEYQNLLIKQMELRQSYAELAEEYKYCKCTDCTIAFMSCSLKLVAINLLIISIEEELPPQLITILALLDIPHSVLEDGSVAIQEK